MIHIFLNLKQRVCVNNVTSDDEIIINGVPQGSILGPLMFLLFINDLPLYTKPIHTDMYADDTTIYEIGISQHEIERNLQLALINLSKWCIANGMVINTAKTKLMLITTHQRRTGVQLQGSTAKNFAQSYEISPYIALKEKSNRIAFCKS